MADTLIANIVWSLQVTMVRLLYLPIPLNLATFMWITLPGFTFPWDEAWSPWTTVPTAFVSALGKQFLKLRTLLVVYLLKFFSH